MKKTILLSSILAVGAAFAADVTVSAGDIGVMGITMPKTVQLVAVPFLGYDVGAEAISDMINTAELEIGSKLYAPSGENQYNIWELTTGTGDSKVWNKIQNNIVIDATGAEKDAVTPGADVSTLSRGGAYWLEPKGTESSTRFYLLGRYTSEAGSSTLVSGKWNLIGNTSGVAKNVLAGKEGEKICVPNGNGGLTVYTYRNKATPSGGWAKEGSRAAVSVSIPCGQGFWYSSLGTTTINW